MKVIDLTGQTFGKVTVLRRGENLSNGGPSKPLAAWVCRCECGKETTIRGRDLRTGNTQSCGCSKVHELLLGKKYGKLTVVGIGEPLLYSVGGRPRGTNRWKCLCDCGGAKDVAPYQLFSGAVKSCGCEWHKTVLDGDEASFRSLLSSYKLNAHKRHLPFLLTNEQFRELTSGLCHYCGKSPHMLHKMSSHPKAKPYLFNGVDRLNGYIGYLRENCVPCCKVHNRMKMKMSEKEFLDNIASVYEWRVVKFLLP